MMRAAILFFVLMIGLLSLPEQSWSLMQECHLRSEIINNGKLERYNWIVKFTYNVDGGELSRSYFIDNKFSPEMALATLYFTENGKIVLLGADGGELQRSKNNFLAQPGYSLPVDVLPDAPANSSLRYSAVRETQGLKFKRYYTMTVQEISLMSAREHGYITFEDDLSGRLLIYNLIDNSGNRVLMQIREEGKKMWLYEETIQRRSWRLK